MRLGKDMISVDGPIKPIMAPHHFATTRMTTYGTIYVTNMVFTSWPKPI